MTHVSLEVSNDEGGGGARGRYEALAGGKLVTHANTNILSRDSEMISRGRLTRVQCISVL